MAKLSKRVKAFKEKVDPAKNYPVREAVAILNELSSVKFKESIDVSVTWVSTRENPIRWFVGQRSCQMEPVKRSGCGVCPG